MKLYYHPLSSNSRRVIATAFQLGLTLELELVDLLAGEHRSPEFLRFNPNAKVPVLVDEGFCLWESHAIVLYLADLTPGQTLYPSDPRTRADVNRWLFWSAYHFTPAIGTISREKVSKRMVGGSGGPDMTEVLRGERLFRESSAVLDAHLAQRSWIADSGLSLADLSVAAPLMHAEAAELPWSPFTHVRRWFDRVQALPAWRAAVDVSSRAASPSADL